MESSQCLPIFKLSFCRHSICMTKISQTIKLNDRKREAGNKKRFSLVHFIKGTHFSYFQRRTTRQREMEKKNDEADGWSRLLQWRCVNIPNELRLRWFTIIESLSSWSMRRKLLLISSCACLPASMWRQTNIIKLDSLIFGKNIRDLVV